MLVLAVNISLISIEVLINTHFVMINSSKKWNQENQYAPQFAAKSPLESVTLKMSKGPL